MITENIIELYYSMLRIRLVEEALASRYKEQEMRCPIHLSIGQEAVAVGVSSALKKDDKVFSNHRGHAHYLAKGGNLNRMFAELYGKATGCCGGRGGSMHLIDLSVGFSGSTPIVGGTVPVAAGAAWAAQLQNTDCVAVAFFGDACFEEGVLHESFNFAALHNLPLIFVCENNYYSVYTRIHERQPDRPIHLIAKAHGWSTDHGDDNNVVSIATITQDAVERAREGYGPQFLEFDTYRWVEHCGPNWDDHLGYRPEGELSAWQEKCPIKRIRKWLTENSDMREQDFNEMEATIQKEIETAFEFALSSTIPDKKDLSRYLYAE
jgi:TPP-dependent pyruvate/acetoin dehydrogenase alpha subunit